MARGRKPIPDEIKELKGNPGKRRLLLKASGVEPPPRLDQVTMIMPEFLTQDREKEIFRRVVEDYLQRRVARVPDLTAYGRWASYVHRWISCKEQLDGKSTWFKSVSKHGEMLRRHPLFRDMLDIERMLMALEDRLGLNPVARQTIIRGLAAMPAALGGMFDQGDDEDREERPAEEIQGETVAVVGALGFLQAAGKTH